MVRDGCRSVLLCPSRVPTGRASRPCSSFDFRVVAMAAILNASAIKGLSEAEACHRLKQDGPNELPEREGRGLIRTAFEVLREPMILLLLTAGSVYIVLGDREEAV